LFPGIKVSNTPGAVDDATATTALYLIISTLRQYSKAERNLRSGVWKSGLNSGRAFDITGKTLAILGMGGIGTRIAELARAFPMRVIYHNRRPAEGAPSWAEYYPKERFAEFLKEADVLAVSIPLRPETEGFVGEEMIRGLKKGAIIVNTARGKVIDEDATIRALEDDHVCPPAILFVHLPTCLPHSQLGAVGLDVYPNEPEVNPRLLAFDNVTLLPHMGTETKDSQKKMELRALGNLKDFLVHGSGKDLVLEMRPRL
jgi:glyoxylate reductase